MKAATQMKREHEFYKGKLLINEHVTAQRLYQGVEAVYKYGCKACHNDAQFPPKGLCGGCQVNAAEYNATKMWADIKAWKPLINEESIPPTSHDGSKMDEN